MIAGEGENRAALGEEIAERRLPMLDRFPQRIGSGQFAEQVAGDEQNVDFLALAMKGHPLDGSTEIVRAVDAAEPVAQVPIGGVEDAHSYWI